MAYHRGGGGGAMKVREFWKQVLLNGFFTCYRSMLVEVRELGVVHVSVHIVYTRTFSSLLWINMSGQLYRLPYKTASSNGGLLEDTVRRSCKRLIGFQDSPGLCMPLFLSLTCLAVTARPLEFTSHHVQHL